MIVVTGASGKLGQHVVRMLAQKVKPQHIVAAVRSPEKAADLKELGVEVRRADYDDAASLDQAFTGADQVLLISSNEVGRRLEQHRAVVAAAKRAGVERLVYTSLLHADTSGISLAPEHKGTEEAIRASGLSFTFLRNGWYLENYTEQLAPALKHGAMIGSAGEGTVAAASREDFAAAAVAVLTGSGHENRTYELAGDVPFRMPQLAAEVARQSGKPVAYRNLTDAEYEAALAGVGLPAPVAAMLASADAGIRRGELTDASGDLRRLIERPTTSLEQAVAAALK